MMKLADNAAALPISTDLEQISRLLPIRGRQRLLELGCGRAETTRLLAQRFPELEIIATEVDQVQLEKNLAANDMPTVTFQPGGAERIELPDAGVHYVVMLKSLHHVPGQLLEQALKEIARVLVPGGIAYISEPIYGGAFNDIMRLFHDEKLVRQAAFEAVQRAVDAGIFELMQQVFFESLLRFHGFAEFEERILGATHTHFHIDDPMLHKIKADFARHVDQATGIAEFRQQLRVDLLRRPNKK